MSVPSTSTMNIRESYFQHTVLTKTVGDPTYQSLVKLEMECKANGKSVPSTLGGGNQGYLGLIVNPTVYARISPNDPFIRPTLPILPDPTGATAAVVAAQRTSFDAALHEFHTCNLVQRVIVQQLNSALDGDVIANMVDDVTGLLEGTIPEIFQSLYKTYGKISPQALAAARRDTEAIVYNHSRPIVNLFTQISKYAQMADHAGASASQAQLIDFGTIVLTASTRFASDLRKWQAKPELDKTWQAFKTHFIEAQKAIHDSEPAVTTDSLGYHEASPAIDTATSIANQVVQSLVQHRDEDITTITADSVHEQQMLAQLANATQQNQQSQQMAAQMAALASTISSLQTQVHQQNQNPQGRRQGRGGGNDRNNRNQGNDNRNQGNDNRNRNQSRPKCYCHSHGWCTHTSQDCNTPKPGHVATATAANMQGGSTLRCFWI
jgi:hypothetical protein